MNDDRKDAPGGTGRFKLALAAVAAGLLFAAVHDPIDSTPGAAREAAALDFAPAASRYEYGAPVNAVAEPHVEAF